jgi:hypothetical protein
MIRRLLVCAVFSCICGLGHAEEKPKPARHARVLAIGDLPTFRQEIRDGIAYELDPPPGSVPPNQVIPGFGEETADAVSLRLGFITPSIKVPGGEGPLLLRRKDAAPEATPWLTVQRPAEGDFLIYLFRTAAKNTWDEPAAIVVPDGAATPAGSVRITNLFPQAVRVAIGKEGILLERGKSFVRALKPGVDVPFQILIPDAAGAMKAYYSGSVTQNPGERGLVTIYRADGEKPRRPLKVSMLREPVVAPPKEEKKP